MPISAFFIGEMEREMRNILLVDLKKKRKIITIFLSVIMLLILTASVIGEDNVWLALGKGMNGDVNSGDKTKGWPL